MSSKGNDEECVIHSKTDNVENTANDKSGENIEEFFQSLLSRYQIGQQH